MAVLSANAAKPVTILTGFLGSGKTTYLNYLLQNQPDKKFAIIENEFGEQSIDSDLIIRAEDDIVELNNGCLCCTLNDNLYDILNTLFDRRFEYDEVVIEATGVADPTGLAEPFIIHPAIKNQFPIKNIICLVDAELIEDQLNDSAEALPQILYSDVILVNKPDLVQKRYLDQLVTRLQELNPLATVVLKTDNGFPEIKENNKQLKLNETLKPKNNQQTSFPVNKPHHHHHHDHTDVVSITLEFDQRFSGQLLHHNLFVFLTFQSKGLYRIKGIIWLEGQDNPHILQSVGKRFSIEEKPDHDGLTPEKSTIVFIGKNLKQEGLERILKHSLAKTKINN